MTETQSRPDIDTTSASSPDPDAQAYPDGTQASGIGIPINIFSPELGTFESLVKYLRASCGIGNSEVARLLGRSRKTISSAFYKAIAKSPAALPEPRHSYSGIFVPLGAMVQRELGILESVCLYLKAEAGLKYSEISRLMHRDQRTVWTAVNRARKKQMGAAAK